MNATEIAAWLGAAGSIGIWLFEIYKHITNKPKLKFRIGSGLEIIGETLEGKLAKIDPDKEFWSVDVSNVGNKKITINQLTIERTDTKVFSMLTKDYNGRIPVYTLEEGENHSYTIPNDLIAFDKVKRVSVMDATGRVYKKKVKH